jgi:hypothetical protein
MMPRTRLRDSSTKRSVALSLLFRHEQTYARLVEVVVFPTPVADEGKPNIHYEHGLPVLNPQLSDIQREQQDAKKREKEQLSLNQQMVNFTRVLAVCSIVAAFLSSWQSCIAKRSADAATSAAETATKTLNELHISGSDTHDLAVQAEKQSSNTEKFAKAAQEQAQAARIQALNMGVVAKNAVRALASSQANFIDEQRAWVAIFGSHVYPFANGQPFKVDLDVANTGKSPSLNGRRWGRYGFPAYERDCTSLLRRFPDLYVAPMPQDQITEEGALAPQQHATIHITLPWEVFQPDYAGVVDKTKVACILGRIEYEDVARRKHGTEFCMYLSDPAKTTMSFCASHNGMD